MFWKKSKKLTPTLLRCAHSQQNQLFELFKLLDAQKMCFGAWGRSGMSNNSLILYHFENVP